MVKRLVEWLKRLFKPRGNRRVTVFLTEKEYAVLLTWSRVTHRSVSELLHDVTMAGIPRDVSTMSAPPPPENAIPAEKGVVPLPADPRLGDVGLDSWPWTETLAKAPTSHAHPCRYLRLLYLWGPGRGNCQGTCASPKQRGDICSFNASTAPWCTAFKPTKTRNKNSA